MIWMWVKSLCLSLSEVIKELDEIKLFLNNGCAREASAVTSACNGYGYITSYCIYEADQSA